MVWNDPTEEVLASQRPSRPVWLRASLWTVLAVVVLLVLWGGYRLWVGSQAERHAAACEQARLQQAWPVLEQEALAWARWAPDVVLPWQYAAEAAKRQGRPARAADYLKQVPPGTPDASAVLLDLCDMQFNELNQPLEGEATCQRILVYDPRNVEAHRRLVFFYTMTLQRKKLIQQARTAIRLDCALPEVYLYLTGADWLTLSNAKQLTEYWLQADPDNELFLVPRAIHYLGSQGVLAEAVDVDPNAKPVPQTPLVVQMQKHLDEYLQRFPKNLEVLAYFLKKGCISGDLQRVAALLAQAPPEAMEDNRFWRFKGWLHAAQDEFSEAEAAYRRALELHPLDWQSQHELAGVLRRRQRYDELAVWQQRALDGKELCKQIFRLPNVKSVPKILLTKLVKYARDCGDDEFADHLMLQTSSMR